MKKGFTLIELLVVIGIISVIVLIGTVSWNKAQQSARNNVRKNNLKAMQLALEKFYAQNRRYPCTATFNTSTKTCTGTAQWFGDANGWGTRLTDYVPEIVPKYIDKLPNDPNLNKPNNTLNYGAGAWSGCQNANNAGYLYYSDGKTYKLIAHCLPEGDLPAEDPYFDPIRAKHAWQVGSETVTSN